MVRILTAVLLMLAAVPPIPAARVDEPVTKAMILRQAVAALESIEDSSDRVRKLVAIALAQTAAGDQSAAREMLSHAAAAADCSGAAYSCKLIIDAQVTVGDFAGATAVAGRWKDPRQAAEALRKIAAAQAAAGARAEAAATFRQALDRAEPITDLELRAATFAAIASGQARAGDRSAALSGSDTFWRHEAST